MIKPGQKYVMFNGEKTLITRGELIFIEEDRRGNPTFLNLDHIFDLLPEWKELDLK